VNDAPRLLDLFCGAGGAAMGYHRAGFEVVGVDIVPQPRYPFESHQADALTFPLDGFNAVHASPPCQPFTIASAFHPGTKAAHDDLIDGVRRRLATTGAPTVIENVPGAPLRHDVLLCGEMFGLALHRHRYFEIGNALCLQPPHTRHRLKSAEHNCHVEPGYTRLVAGHFGHRRSAHAAMGVDWAMTRSELAQAVPPAYTELIGHQLAAHLRSRAARPERLQ
jgi:DNA (cytosine-5)-methyltransferase 1